MADPRIEMFKRFALQQAAMQQPQMAQMSLEDPNMLAPGGASDAGAPAATPSMANPVPNVGQPNTQVQQQPSPQAAGAATPGNPGPIKSFLSQFLYGAGQGLLTKVGLPTDAEKQQVAFNQQQAMQNAAAQNEYRQAQIAALNSQNEQEDLSQYGIPGLTGTAARKDIPRIIAAHVTGQSRENVADTNLTGKKYTADVGYKGKVDVATSNNATKEDIADEHNKTMKEIADMNNRAKITLNLNGLGNDPYAKQAVAQVATMYKDAADAGARMRAMDSALTSAESPTGNAQADMVLLMNHIGMTGGAQKGFRMTEAEINSAAHARGFGDDVAVMFNKVKRGDRLSSTERKQMVELAHSQYDNIVQRADQQADLFGIPKPKGRQGFGGNNIPAPQTNNHPFFQQFGGTVKKP